MTELGRIADVVQQVAEAISVALNVHVEIVDAENICIGATAQRSQLTGAVGKKQKYGHVSQRVIDSGKSIVIENPGYHEICNICAVHQKCDYTSGVYCPIMFDGKVIGVISLVTFDAANGQRVIDNQSQIMEFIRKMAELLSDKLAKVRLNDLLELK